MSDEKDFSLSSEETQAGCLQTIWYSTKGLIELIEENAADIVADDMADESNYPFSFKPLKNLRLHSWPVFVTGVFFGALGVFGTLKYTAMQEASDRMAEDLIQERAAEEQTLTPIADIDLPLVSPSVSLPETQSAAEEPAPAVFAPDHLDTFTIKPQQSLAAVLKQGALTNREIKLVLNALSDVLNLKKIQAGTIVEIGRMNTDTAEKSLLLVTVEDRHGNRYTAARAEDDSFEASLVEPKVDIKTE